MVLARYSCFAAKRCFAGKHRNSHIRTRVINIFAGLSGKNTRQFGRYPLPDVVAPCKPSGLNNETRGICGDLT